MRLRWEAATGKERATFRGHTNWVNSVAFSPDGKTLASGSWDRTIKLWDVATGKQQATLKGPEQGGLNSVAFSPDGKTLASGGPNGTFYGTIKLWELSPAK